MRTARSSHDAQRASRIPKITGPALSVVLVSTRSRAALEALLSQLLGRCAAIRAELIVVRPEPPGLLLALKQLYSPARFVPAGRGLTAAEMRMAGVREANGDILLLATDDDEGEARLLASLEVRAAAAREREEENSGSGPRFDTLPVAAVRSEVVS